jgi:hypothetical protein
MNYFFRRYSAKTRVVGTAVVISFLFVSCTHTYPDSSDLFGSFVSEHTGDTLTFNGSVFPASHVVFFNGHCSYRVRTGTYIKGDLPQQSAWPRMILLPSGYYPRDSLSLDTLGFSAYLVPPATWRSSPLDSIHLDQYPCSDMTCFLQVNIEKIGALALCYAKASSQVILSPRFPYFEPFNPDTSLGNFRKIQHSN